MAATADSFNWASIGFEDDILNGKKKTEKAGSDQNLEFLLLLEMYRDKPEMQKMMDAIDKRSKLKGRKFASTAFLKAIAFGRLHDRTRREQETKKLPSSAMWTNMMNAAYHNRIDMLLRQIKRGMRVDQRGEFGETARSMAASRGNTQILQLIDLAQNYIAIMQKNAYSERKDPMLAHFYDPKWLAEQQHAARLIRDKK
jgi:hypothetical protein